MKMKYLLFAFSQFLTTYISAQLFKLGTIDIYGNRKISSELIYTSLGIKEGDSINPVNLKKEDIASKIRQTTGIKFVNINPVCCDKNNDLMLYIGIGETDSITIKYRDVPTKNLRLPAEMIDAYSNLEKQMEPAILKGQATEDDSRGYAVSAYTPAGNEQKKFIGFASKKLALLVNILKNSAHEMDRAAAIEIIAYAADKKKVAENLLFAVDDPDDEVRNNATRALGILAGYLHAHPELKINIDASPFIAMLNSIIWTDRNKGASVLMQLTESRSPQLLAEIKRLALPSVIEMAKWKDRAHSLWSFIILGRIAGIDEKVLINQNFSDNYAENIRSMVEKCCR
jgi:hypothetical protein